VPARIIYSWAELVSLIIYNIDEIFTSVLKTGVFCLYTIRAGMDVLQSFFGGRTLSAHIRPFIKSESRKWEVGSRKWFSDFTTPYSLLTVFIGGNERAGAEVLSSGEENSLLSAHLFPFCGRARLSFKNPEVVKTTSGQVSSGEDICRLRALPGSCRHGFNRAK